MAVLFGGLLEARRLKRGKILVEHIGIVDVGVVDDREERLLEVAPFFFDPLGDELIVSTEIKVGFAVQMGRDAAARDGQVLNVLAGVTEHQVLTGPVGPVVAGGVRVVPEERHRVEQLAPLGTAGATLA